MYCRDNFKYSYRERARNAFYPSSQLCGCCVALDFHQRRWCPVKEQCDDKRGGRDDKLPVLPTHLHPLNTEGHWDMKGPLSSSPAQTAVGCRGGTVL